MGVESKFHYKPLFPYFGGKSRVADVVWERFGKVNSYCEPFFGSGAVLFKRPHEKFGQETVNDIDHMIVNFWRAVKYAPEEVAEYVDNPVNEADLLARHIWLVKHGLPRIAERIVADPDFYDAKVAGWWCWGLCCWIGRGWCKGDGKWTEENGVLVEKGKEECGATRKLPNVSGGGIGVHRNRPHVSNLGCGVNRQIPRDGHSGRGLHSKSFWMGSIDERKEYLINYFNMVCSRLRNVQVCCGDWSRITTPCLLWKSSVGIFFDPPYPEGANRKKALYRVDDLSVAKKVEEWCIENGDNPRYRIALCGYEGTHDILETMGWDVYKWEAGRSYPRSASYKESQNEANRVRERIWFSPHCLKNNDFFRQGGF